MKLVILFSLLNLSISQAHECEDLMERIDEINSLQLNTIVDGEQTFGEFLSEYSSLAESQEEADQERLQAVAGQLEGFQTENPTLKNLSIIKKKFAQDYVLSCDLTEEDREKLELACNGHSFLGENSEETLQEHVQHNMEVVQFLAIELQRIDDSEFAHACDELAEAGPQPPGCVPSEAYIQTAEDEHNRQKRNGRLRTVGKFAAYTALAGGAVAATVWAINRWGSSGDNNSSTLAQSANNGSGRLIPANYRSSYFYPRRESSLYQNINYSHFYGYPQSWTATKALTVFLIRWKTSALLQGS